MEDPLVIDLYILLLKLVEAFLEHLVGGIPYQSAIRPLGLLALVHPLNVRVGRPLNGPLIFRIHKMGGYSGPVCCIFLAG